MHRECGLSTNRSKDERKIAKTDLLNIANRRSQWSEALLYLERLWNSKLSSVFGAGHKEEHVTLMHEHRPSKPESMQCNIV